MTGFLIILLIIVFIYWRKSNNSIEEFSSYKKDSSSDTSMETEEFEDISVTTEDLDESYKEHREEQIQFSNKTFLDEEKLKKEFKGRYRKKISSKENDPKPIETFRGYDFQPSFESEDWETYEGHYSSLRRVCSDSEIITEYQMWDYHRNYYDSNNIDGIHDSRGQMWDESLRRMRDLFFKPWKEKYYDKKTKTWSDFDIDRVYFQTRSLMLGKPDFPIPNYVHLLDDRPFTYCWRLTRDYMKWKGTKRVTKKVFDNVVKWESGNIFKENERENKELYEPLWINWNDVGKVILQMRTKLKKEDKGGYDWLVSDVKDYILNRVSFYDRLGEDSNYKVREDLITKYEKLK